MRINRLVLLAIVLLSCSAALPAPAQDESGYQPESRAGLEVRQTFLSQARAVRDQDLDLWGAITRETIVLDGQAHEQFDFFLVMLGQAQNDPEAFEAAHDPDRIQDIVVLGDTAMLYYDDPSGRVVQFEYLRDDDGGWQLSGIW